MSVSDGADVVILRATGVLAERSVTVPLRAHGETTGVLGFIKFGDRGWSDEDLVKLAGANVLRVLRGAESVARDLQSTRGPSLATFAELDGA